ncbi:hypothetical protein F8M41_009172 [Gigaspora margarita]|uniref:Uncharacterized protein n=1 Tax=Gigaspora margarita TaxID=4874 RepID=A0A8H3X496_GIGMA|nr:hypothetical protein F8M41_009172 [Gigaspora margarita]
MQFKKSIESRQNAHVNKATWRKNNDPKEKTNIEDSETLLQEIETASTIPLLGTETTIEEVPDGIVPEKEITRQVPPRKGETNQVIMEDVMTSNESEQNTHLVEQTPLKVVTIQPKLANCHEMNLL